MADSRNNLKKADAEKSYSVSQNVIIESVGAKMGSIGTSGTRLAVKRKLPVFVDVIIGVIILAIFAGIVVGAYFMFRYYTNDYAGVKLEYVFISPCAEDIDAFRTMKNKDLYFDLDGNTLYFGKVTNVDVVDSVNTGKYLVLNVSADAKYKSGEGYTIGESKMAVGSEYSLRVDGRVVVGTIVELREEGEALKNKTINYVYYSDGNVKEEGN